MSIWENQSLVHEAEEAIEASDATFCERSLMRGFLKRYPMTDEQRADGERMVRHALHEFRTEKYRKSAMLYWLRRLVFSVIFTAAVLASKPMNSEWLALQILEVLGTMLMGAFIIELVEMSASYVWHKLGFD